MSEEAFDLVVVGAGIVGLGAAYEGLRRGLRVAVLERSAGVQGASVRNFGHVGVTGQSGEALGYALEARERWLALAAEAGFWTSQRGGAIVARGEEEQALLEQLAAERGHAQLRLHGADAIREATGAADARITGGALLPLDLQVDPREAAPAIARHLEARGVVFRWGTAALSIEPGSVTTASGTLRADAVVVAVNADVDQFFPQLAAEARLRRCGLDMLLLDWRGAPAVPHPLLTGSSMLRYSAFAGLDGAEALRERIAYEQPEMIERDVNQMVTQRPDGTLIVGDTHYRGHAVAPFQEERSFAYLLELNEQLFARRAPVLQRWQGVYASAPQEFLLADPAPGVRVASVTTGIGMTTGLGFAAHAVAGLL